jgi:hypothetical protein
MKKLVPILAAAVLGIPTLVLGYSAQQSTSQMQDQGKVVAEETVAESAVVKAVDVENRTVTLALTDGTWETFPVDPSFTRLNEVKPGDIVNARYTEAVSVKLNKTRVPTGMSVESKASPAQNSVNPAGRKELRVTTTATITKITDNGKSVTLLLPDGSSSKVKVRDPDNLAMIKRGEVKTGDQISITYTQAVAVSVEKAPKK